MNTEKFKQQLSRARGVLRAFRFPLGNPTQDWMLLLATFVVASAILVTYSLEHFKSLSDFAHEENATSTPPLIDPAAINRVSNDLDVRATTFSSLRKNPPSLIDPSR